MQTDQDAFEVWASEHPFDLQHPKRVWSAAQQHVLMKAASDAEQAIYKGMAQNYLAPQPAIPDGWQPIETAPKDSTPVDIWRSAYRGERCPNMRRVDLGNGNVFYEAMSSGPSCVRDATHWMPLPAAPKPGEPT